MCLLFVSGFSNFINVAPNSFDIHDSFSTVCAYSLASPRVFFKYSTFERKFKGLLASNITKTRKETEVLI